MFIRKMNHFGSNVMKTLYWKEKRISSAKTESGRILFQLAKVSVRFVIKRASDVIWIVLNLYCYNFVTAPNAGDKRSKWLMFIIHKVLSISMQYKAFRKKFF